jgi:PAS domain S-box-containing protein
MGIFGRRWRYRLGQGNFAMKTDSGNQSDFNQKHEQEREKMAEYQQQERTWPEMVAQYDAIFEAFDGPIYICSQDYKIGYMNRDFIERIGHYPLGQKCYQALYNLAEKCPWCEGERVFQGEKVRREWLNPQDNRWYAAVNTLLRTPDGRKLQMALITDITEKQQAEEAFKSLVSYSPIGIYVIQDRLFKLVNPGFLNITGYLEEDLLGKDIFFLVSPKYRESVRKNAIRLLKGERPAPYEYQFFTKNGETRWVVETVISTNYQGRRATLGYFLEITERKRIEEALRRTNEELNEANRQLHLEVAERRRAEELLEYQAQELARSNQELQSFAYIASHDLQEPLRKVIAFGDRLQTKEAANLSSLGKDYLSRMQNAAIRMRQLIEDLLAFSRVTTKAQPFQRIDLNELVNEVLIDLEERIARLGAHIDVDPLPTVEAEPTQMRQLFQNLLANAMKFHRENISPVIAINCRNIDNATFEIKVVDNGIGMDQKYSDRIFKPFQRLHGKGVYEGTGIGLAICQKIVVRHGGTIKVESTPGNGAAFIITMPLFQPQKESGHDEKQKVD